MKMLQSVKLRDGKIKYIVGYILVVWEFPKSDDIHDLGFFHVGLDPKGPKNI